jgi:hypothetical protein
VASNDDLTLVRIGTAKFHRFSVPVARLASIALLMRIKAATSER